MSWIRSNRLAIGPFPLQGQHWQQLASQGVQRVFSCCSALEGNWNPPPEWLYDRVALPDYRSGENLTPLLLEEAINRAMALYAGCGRDDNGALYLHCWAGQQRSPLLAAALLQRSEGIALLDALAEVRRLHPASQPITTHLAILDALVTP